MTAQQAIQAKIEATERFEAIKYGQRTLEEMGGRAYGISAEWGAPEWALAQWAAASEALSELGFTLDDKQAGWQLRQAKRQAQEQLKAASAAAKAIGSARQQRLALAA